MELTLKSAPVRLSPKHIAERIPAATSFFEPFTVEWLSPFVFVSVFTEDNCEGGAWYGELV